MIPDDVLSQPDRFNSHALFDVPIYDYFLHLSRFLPFFFFSDKGCSEIYLYKPPHYYIPYCASGRLKEEHFDLKWVARGGGPPTHLVTKDGLPLTHLTVCQAPVWLTELQIIKMFL